MREIKIEEEKSLINANVEDKPIASLKILGEEYSKASLDKINKIRTSQSFLTALFSFCLQRTSKVHSY